MKGFLPPKRGVLPTRKSPRQGRWGRRPPGSNPGGVPTPSNDRGVWGVEHTGGWKGVGKVGKALEGRWKGCPNRRFGAEITPVAKPGTELETDFCDSLSFPEASTCGGWLPACANASLGPGDRRAAGVAQQAVRGPCPAARQVSHEGVPVVLKLSPCDLEGFATGAILLAYR